MSFFEFDIDTIQDFLEQLCTEHVDILHSESKRGFARFESDEHMEEIKGDGGPNIVVVVEVGGRRVGHQDDQTVGRTLVLRFACYAEPGDSSTKKIAIRKAEKIMFDFQTRLEREQHQNDCGPMRDLEPEKSSWERIEDQPWLQNHYGWDLALSFKSYMPAFNTESWS